MNRSRRLSGYLLIGLVLFGAMLMGPRAWATSNQTQPGQGISVPTATPIREWSPPPPATARPTDPPSERPTDRPPINATATSTSRVATPTAPAAASTPTVPATATPGAGAELTLVKEADRLQLWPGEAVRFTLTLSNPGAVSARQVTLEDTLPAGLEPGAVEGTSAAWDGRTLPRPLAPAPARRQAGDRLQRHRACGCAGRRAVGEQRPGHGRRGLNARADAYLAMPPVELPAVGGAVSDLRPQS